MNSHSAKLFGVEFEIYKNLTFLGEGDLLKKIFLCGNAAFNDTEVTGYERIDGEGGLYKANRPLYGQAPYNYNLGLDYIGERAGFSIRHNAIGDQYILVGFNYDAEEIRKPYSVTDAQMSYKLGKERDIELKVIQRSFLLKQVEIQEIKEHWEQELQKNMMKIWIEHCSKHGVEEALISL
jgi:hypothetical protein